MSKFVCSLPWKHLSVTPHGWASVCCEPNWDSNEALARSNNEVLHVSDGIEKIINSDSFKSIRKDMLNGKIPEACSSCSNLEKTGGHSKRLREKPPPPNLKDITSEDGSISPALSNIELRLGNFCNLKCRSCNAESSTSWIDDYNKLKNKINLPSSYDVLKERGVSYDWVENPEVYLDLIQNIYKPEVLHISGGEPFLVDKHSHLLDLFIEKGLAKDITVAYITNGSYSIDKITPILNKLKNFQHVLINFSLDDTYKRNDYIRKLSKFEKVVDTIKSFTSIYDFEFQVTQTIHVFNFLYVEELHLFLEKEGLYKKDGSGVINTINDNFVVFPEYHNVNVLPKHVRQKKIDSIEGIVDERFFERIKKTFYDSESNNKMSEFIMTTEAVDSVRGEKFKNIFTKLSKELPFNIESTSFSEAYDFHFDTIKPIERYLSGRYPLSQDNRYHKTQLWLAPDTKNKYNLHLSKFPELMKFYEDNPITYNINNHMCRSDFDYEKDRNMKVDIFLGCSHTFGIGTHKDFIWTNYITNHTSNIPINLGLGGGSAEDAFMRLIRVIDYYDVKNVFWYIPHTHRYSFKNGDLMNRFSFKDFHKIIPYKDWYLKSTLISEEYANYYNYQNIMAVAGLCQYRDIKLYISNLGIFDPKVCLSKELNENGVVLSYELYDFDLSTNAPARDLQHHSNGQHKAIANQFLEYFKEYPKGYNPFNIELNINTDLLFDKGDLYENE